MVDKKIDESYYIKLVKSSSASLVSTHSDKIESIYTCRFFGLQICLPNYVYILDFICIYIIIYPYCYTNTMQYFTKFESADSS